MFHLVYNWIRVTTHLHLETSSVWDQSHKSLFPDEKAETVILEEAISVIGKNEDLAVIFNIFTKDARAK